MKLYCHHSGLFQASKNEFESGKSSQSRTRKHMVKQKKKKRRLFNCRTQNEAPLTDNGRCNFHMKIFCAGEDQCWCLQTQKPSNKTMHCLHPMRHCHHCKHDPHLITTFKDLWTDEMNKDAKAACDIHIPTKDVSNFLLKNMEATVWLLSC